MATTESSSTMPTESFELPAKLVHPEWARHPSSSVSASTLSPASSVSPPAPSSASVPSPAHTHSLAQPPYPSTPNRNDISLQSPYRQDPAMHSPYAMDSSPMVTAQLMQMQQQMSMLSQAMTMQQQQQQNTPTGGSRDSMLCFSLGERLGALNKHEEVTKDSIRELGSVVQESASSVSEMKASVRALETNVSFYEKCNEQLKSHSEKLALSLNESVVRLGQLTKDQEHYKESSDRFQKQQKKENEALRAHVKEVDHSLNLCHSSVRELNVEQTRERETIKKMAKKMDSLNDSTSALSSKVEAVAVSLQRNHADSERSHANLAKALSKQSLECSEAIDRESHQREQQFMLHHQQTDRRVESLQNELQNQLRQLQLQLQTIQQQQQQQQTQMMMIQNQSPSESIGLSMVSLVLQSFMPFVPYDSVHWMASSIFSAFESIRHSTHLRTLVAMAVTCDISFRLLDRFCPIISKILCMLSGYSRLSASSRFAIRVARILLEISLVVHLWAVVAEYVREKYLRARDQFLSLNECTAKAKTVITCSTVGVVLLGACLYNRRKLTKAALATYATIPALSVSASLNSSAISDGFSRSLESVRMMRDRVAERFPAPQWWTRKSE